MFGNSRTIVTGSGETLQVQGHRKVGSGNSSPLKNCGANVLHNKPHGAAPTQQVVKPNNDNAAAAPAPQGKPSLDKDSRANFLRACVAKSLDNGNYEKLRADDRGKLIDALEKLVRAQNEAERVPSPSRGP